MKRRMKTRKVVMGTDVIKLKVLLICLQFSLLFAGFSIISADQLCHPACFCLDTFFDCRKQGLSSFPVDFPNWIQKLNLSNNDISSVSPAAAARLQKLEALSLDSNSFSSIPNLGELPRLVQLSLAKNNISHVEAEGLSSLKSLEELDLSRNRIETLSNNSFPADSSLRILNLGYNNVEVISPGWLDPLVELLQLNLVKNKLRVLHKDTFFHLKSLEQLDLSRNKLEMIDSLRFQELKNLQQLNLRKNHMSNLSDAAFYGLERIEQLFLDGNNIKYVEKRWLYGLRSLKELNLSKNDIGKIEDDSWEFMEELQILDLNTNKIEAITKRTFSGLTKIKFLDLSFNQISDAEEDAFASLQKLEHLDLSNNELSWVLEDTSSPFRGLAECETLNLANNKIHSIHPQALNDLPSLTLLNLTSNPIIWLSGNAFEDHPFLNILLQDVNSFVCDCESAWLRSRLLSHSNKGKARHRDYERRGSKSRDKNKSGAPPTPPLFCANPTELSGLNLLEVPLDNLTCSDTSMKPEFLEEPKTEIFLMEGNGTLSCHVQSFASDPLTLVWKKDRKDLPKHLESQVSNLQRLEDTGATTVHSTMELVNVSWNYAGTYQCVAENSYGVVYSSKANVTVHIFPTFIKKPSNVTVKLGSNAKLECAAKGYPTPEIAFCKDGGEDFPAALDRRFHVMPNDDSFFIMEVKISDMGVYCCSARNAAGEVKAYATVTVYETPSFSDPMEDESAVEGNNAILSCLAAGSPKPLISWNKDGVLIAPEGKENQNNNNNNIKNKRYHFTENGTFLLIKDVQLDDAGRYECLLSNAVGTTRASSTLTVLPNSAGKSLHLDTSAMTIIFIIIAVFCVVGTSAAWVVVIYRTRKRNMSAESRHSKYKGSGDEDENRPGFSGGIVPAPFSSSNNCQSSLGKGGAGCPDSDSQSSSGKDSGTGDDIAAETDPMAIMDVAEQESLMRPGRKKELESFSTFGMTRASAAASRISQVRLNELQGDLSDVISLAHPPGREFQPHQKRMTKVSVPVPPSLMMVVHDKEAAAAGGGLIVERRSNSKNNNCGSNSSSSGYSSSTLGGGSKVKGGGDLAESVNSEELESLQDHISVEDVDCMSTPV